MTACRRIWRYKPVEAGLRARWWLAEAGPHIDPYEWSGPLDSVSQFPLPTAAAPDFDLVTNAANINDAATGAARYSVIDGWVWLPNNVTHWRDSNGNTGEFGMVLSGGCCGGSLVEQPGGNHTVNTAGADPTIMDVTPVTGGWHYIFNPMSDSGFFHGLDLDYSIDGGNTWLPATRRQPTKPEIEGFDIPCCQELTEAQIAAGWSLDPLPECCQPTYNPVAEGAGETDIAAVKQIALQCIQDNQTPLPLTTQLPTPDQDGAFKRQGWAGDSGLILHHNHSHAIVRLPNPGYQVMTVTGGVLAAQVDYGFASSEETVYHRYRLDITVPAGNGWCWWNVPTIPGFQRPMLASLTTYRTTNINPQSSLTSGEQPDGPFMGSEAAEWTNIPRIYVAGFNHPEEARYFVHFTTINVCL